MFDDPYLIWSALPCLALCSMKYGARTIYYASFSAFYPMLRGLCPIRPPPSFILHGRCSLLHTLTYCRLPKSAGLLVGGRVVHGWLRVTDASLDGATGALGASLESPHATHTKVEPFAPNACLIDSKSLISAPMRLDAVHPRHPIFCS